MKPEQAEQFLIEELFRQSKERGILINDEIVSIDRLTGDASTRRYYRLFLKDTTLVACLDNPTLSADETNPFVSHQQFLKENGIRVPDILDINLSKGYILEEDLGDITYLSYLSKIKSDKEELKYYQIIIDQLLNLHKIPLDKIASSNISKLKFDYQKLMDEMEFTFKFFIKNFLQIQDEVFIENLRKEIQPICERLAKEKMVLTHRDFHSRNLMVKNNEFIFIDFQDARLGIPQYDLVSLLEDCYYDLKEENRIFLKKYYFENFLDLQRNQKNFQTFELHYNDMLFQRVFKAIGSFSYIYATRKDVRYLKYIGFAMEKLRKMMLHDHRFDHLRITLFEQYYVS
jgi:aminoglycoside/choline kinase family phosphotransferase